MTTTTNNVQNNKILIVDDSATQRELSGMMLQRNGFDIKQASSASNILEIIAEYKPNLILLDIMMPEMDGNQALQIIRKQYKQIELPVIMVTGKSDASDVIESLKNGANDFITKPVQFDVALRRIETQLMLAKQSQTMSQLSEITAIQAMITTYNHEINNPLAIALGNLAFLQKKYANEAEIPKLENALMRIAEIVKKTNNVLQQGSVEFKKYTDTANMLNLSNNTNKN